MKTLFRSLICTFVAAGCLAGEDAPKPEKKPDTPTTVAPNPTATPATPIKPAPVIPVAPVVTAPKRKPQPVPEATADVKDMTNPRYLLDLAQVHLRYNALDRAEELLRKAQPNAKEPDVKTQIGAALGTLLQRKQDFAGAATALEEVIGQASSMPMRAQYTLNLVDVYRQQSDASNDEKLQAELATKTEKLLNGLSEAVGPKPKPEEAWIKNQITHRLMQLWQGQPGKLEQMVASAEEALAKAPDNVDLMERLGEMYNSSGKRDPAKVAALYEKLSAAKPTDAMTLARLAGAYQETRNFDKALEIHRKLITMDPRGQGQTSTYQVAQLLLQSGKKDEAVAWAKDHMNDANSPYSGIMMANFLENAGMTAEAEAAYLKLRETAQPQQKAEYSLRIAEFARRKKEYKKAEEELQSVLKDFPEDKSLAPRAKAALARLAQEQARANTPPQPAPAPNAPPAQPNADAPKAPPAPPKTDK